MLMKLAGYSNIISYEFILIPQYHVVKHSYSYNKPIINGFDHGLNYTIHVISIELIGTELNIERGREYDYGFYLFNNPFFKNLWFLSLMAL